MKYALAALAVIIALFTAICAYAFNQSVWGKPLPLPKFLLNMTEGAQSDDEEKFQADHHKAQEEFLAMPLENIEITAPDGAILRGHILEPETKNGRVLVMCHGAHSSDSIEFCFIYKYLLKEGYTLVMPNHRGCGISDGKYLGYGTHESKDTFLWVDLAEKRFPDMPIFLLGVSMGAATVLMMSEHIDDPRIKGIVADCPYTSEWDEFAYQLKESFHFPTFPALNICNMFSHIFCGYDFKDASPLEAVKNAKVPILFIHGKADTFVPYSMQDELYDACPTEKTRVGVEGAIHARSYYTNSAVYEKAISEFFDKYDPRG